MATTTITLMDGTALEVEVQVGHFESGINWRDDAGHHTIPWSNIARIDRAAEDGDDEPLTG